MEAQDWKAFFAVEVAEGIDLDRAGIYQWTIDGIGTYVGQSRRIRKRLVEYPNNVRKLVLGLPYRKGKPDAFRHIHRQLAEARAGRLKVTFAVIENCSGDELNARERHWIALRGTLNR